ncbi:hypothetical protein [Egbenema bharatensis]|uniref:hypothetical protein n=1 Tax=Egbenema bharatensis TaxID=3463334 RepID=UPI003A8AEBC8
MSTQEEARKAAAQQRQDEKHLQQSMRSRSEEALEVGDRHTSVTEEARERMVEEHQHEKHIQKTMLNRAESELGVKHGEDSAHQ